MDIREAPREHEMTNKRSNPVQQVMDEYVIWGGPIVTRKVAYDDMQARGFDARAIDISVFGRKSVEAPADPIAHLAFFRQIQAL
jgi:hypothetical protein